MPSTIAVFPTPGSPTKRGLFFKRLDNICIVLSISKFLPINLSIFLFLAFSIRLIVKSPLLSSFFFHSPDMYLDK